MKVLSVILLLFIGVHSIPVNTEPFESHEWAIVPDGDGSFHLEDLKEAQLSTDYKDFQASRDVVFRLYTYSTLNQIVRLGDASSLAASNFNPNHPTRFIVHGWISDSDSEVNKLIQSAYHTRGDFNVFIVDWSSGAMGEYTHCAYRVEDVGKTVADFIIFVYRETGIELLDVTVIGHSLGAHIAGIAGRNAGKVGKIGAVVGLDAAHPLFELVLADIRIDSRDAYYVETIHTSTLLLGFGPPLGVASFYPNYGQIQPGCSADITGSCSHSRAYKYFAESITSDKGFWARRCQNYDDILYKSCISTGEDVLMGGEPSNVNASGVYWLPTNTNSPYATGKIS
ncbi:hypothetical protein DMENIID0001_110900 [Sergentomyia squamirostris]